MKKVVVARMIALVLGFFSTGIIITELLDQKFANVNQTWPINLLIFTCAVLFIGEIMSLFRISKRIFFYLISFVALSLVLTSFGVLIKEVSGHGGLVLIDVECYLFYLIDIVIISVIPFLDKFIKE